MKNEQTENLFLLALDTELSKNERLELQQVMESDPSFAKYKSQYLQLRTMLSDQKGKTFGPFFAERVAYRLQSLHQEIEFQLLTFFKKYQLIAVGLVVALLSLNIILSESLSLKSVIGLEDVTITDSLTDISQIDLFSNLTK